MLIRVALVVLCLFAAAEAARRSTSRSNAWKFDSRIFDLWSLGIQSKELSGAGDDRPP